MRKKSKKNDTGLRVLEVLKILIQQSASAEDLIKLISDNQDFKNIYAKETLLKYFNTLEFVGLFVEKNRKDGKYFLRNMPLETEFSEEELKLLCILESYVMKLYQRKLEEPFSGLLENLKKSFSKKTRDKYIEVKEDSKINMDAKSIYNSALVKLLEKYCVDAQKLKIGYLSKSDKSTEIYKVEPKSIVYESDMIYLHVYNPELAQNQKLILDNIIHVVQLPQKITSNISPNTIVFELKGRLLNTYKLKLGEKVINTSSESMVVSNDIEDKMLLFRRLLKYGENCKILQPKNVQKEFLDFVDKVIASLEQEVLV